MIDLIEIDIVSGKRTGRVLTFDAKTKPGALKMALYTAKLKDGRAAIGPTGLVVYPHGPDGTLCWVPRKEKSREPAC